MLMETLEVDLCRNQTGGLDIYGGAGKSNTTQSSLVSQGFNNNTDYVGMYGGLCLVGEVKLAGAIGYTFGHVRTMRTNLNIVGTIIV